MPTNLCIQRGALSHRLLGFIQLIQFDVCLLKSASESNQMENTRPTICSYLCFEIERLDVIGINSLGHAQAIESLAGVTVLRSSVLITLWYCISDLDIADLEQ